MGSEPATQVDVAATNSRSSAAPRMTERKTKARANGSQVFSRRFF